MLCEAGCKTGLDCKRCIGGEEVMKGKGRQEQENADGYCEGDGKGERTGEDRSQRATPSQERSDQAFG